MITYIPFLKAKSGELTAMGELTPDVKRAICPLFDFPRNNENYTSLDYAKKISKIERGLTKHWGVEEEFYFDDFDISQKLEVEGEHKYAAALRALQKLQVIPVVGLDRTAHNDSVVELKRKGIIDSATVALRAEQVDFEDFEAKKDDIEDLENVFDEFEAIDLIFDCRLCSNMDVPETAQQIATFARKFSDTYEKIRRIIITGSSIPASIRDAVGTDEVVILPRRELEIIAKARDLLVGIGVIPGDYTTVSPLFADMKFDPMLFQKVTAPRLVYSFDNFHYISRGTSLASGGQDQYIDMTKALCNEPFFRGSGYSFGENYFDEKRRRIGNSATNGTVVKPSVIAHITYMALDASL